MVQQTITLTGDITKNTSIGIAKNLLKKSLNIGDAIVSILSNTGIAGFKFHLPQSEQINMESDITDHYIDTGSAVQDHIARRPIILTVRGYQGEYYYTVHPVESVLSQITSTLALVKQFMPRLPNSTKQYLAKKYKQLSKNNTTPKALTNVSEKNLSGIDLFNLFQEIYKLKSKQTQAFYFFEALWKSEALFSVETSWKRYDNMTIQKIVPLRDDNADITDFTVTFKQINITSSRSERVENAAGRLKNQIAPVTQKGLDKGKEVPIN